MVRILFIHSDGVSEEVAASPGVSLMRAARDHGVTEILAECGGACMCATCHVILSDEWLSRSGEKSMSERELLPFAIDAGPNSRLSCQIIVTEELDGIEVQLPVRQV